MTQEFNQEHELIQRLIKLGWSDNIGGRTDPLLNRPAALGDKERKAPTLTKGWKQGSDLVAIANFLIDTNGLVGIKLSKMDVNLQKEKLAPIRNRPLDSK